MTMNVEHTRPKWPQLLGFTPDPLCDNCYGTGDFTADDPCVFCLEDAIMRGQLDGWVDGVEWKGGAAQPLLDFAI